MNMTPEELAGIFLAELKRQRDGHNGPSQDGIGWLDSDEGLADVVIDGRVNLLAMAEAAIAALARK